MVCFSMRGDDSFHVPRQVGENGRDRNAMFPMQPTGTGCSELLCVLVS